MAHWLGYLVSIKCSNNVSYQGEIVAATNSVISLNKSFCNGIPCSNQNEPVKIRAEDIVDLKLIDKQSTSPQQSSIVTIAKPLAKKASQRSQSLSESANKPGNYSGPHGRSKPIEIEQKPNFNDNFFKNGTPNKKDKNIKGKWTKGWKDEECFGSPCVEEISQDFDFEKNLALFNKQAIWDQLNSNNQKPDIIKQAEARRPTKYRHDENIIASGPVTYRQIQVPKQDYCEYVSDEGLIIPCISRTLRSKLFECVDKAGLNWERRIELMGRAATEISIQLLGGGHRLNPHNFHQWPTVVVLCGPNRQGAMGINTARQLASHGVRTIVYWIPTSNKDVERELSLFQLTKCPVVTNINDLPTTSDLIILALCDEPDDAKSYVELSNWTNKNRAPVLALDPPSAGMPNFNPKFSLLPVLPLSHSSSNGKLYLCNLGIPQSIFKEVGIKYKSPFGPKFVIPLYPKNN
ncbi:hypothetical protein HHI36_002746 [Cryptolaemus montrouzieri]|uniref:Enhancer of mRNA-decapping protein 3 n=1 Tax=Cryptolaemus montrouzieri TaxID=559131 RepID=A0ABD2PBJ7_9CUCU